MLNTDKALELARRLTVVADFPTYSEAIDAVAEDLVVLTENSPDSDIAEARARWLVTEIRRTWTRWSGTADLYTLYRKRFNPPREIKLEDNEAKDYDARKKPPIQCHVCNDTGVFKQEGRASLEPYQWCECETGILLHFDLPDWLNILNDTMYRLSPENAGHILKFTAHPAAAKPVSPEIECRIQRVPTCPACLANDFEMPRSHTHQEYWQHHTKQEIAQ